MTPSKIFAEKNTAMQHVFGALKTPPGAMAQ
jgi:hypothetical protein